MINRQEITDKLNEKALDPIIVTPAMHFIEKTLEHIEKGYDLIPNPTLKIAEICNAIAGGIDAKVTDIQLVRLGRETPNEARLLFGGRRGEPFSTVLFAKMYMGIKIPFPRIPKLTDYGGNLAEE